ncbi:hypothetical protein C5L39_01095 [Corynebacterium alimapuense]|uniref:N-acetylmuramoyl-L-alanine amidase n=2 Tax=Corynebacterium alimapuense TaxID=1576874 RepID=A0A3M8KC89_9CORY|nr:hypothetical protein C5L39_01095 [Corynebacterium alimapuense]
MSRQASVRPTLAAILSVSLVVSAAVGGNQILKTQQADPGPVSVMKETESFATGANVVIEDAAISAQSGEAGPRTVKEFTRDETFSMFAVTWDGQRDLAAYVRAEAEDGSWSPWYDAEPVDQLAADGKGGTDLLYIEPTNRVQVSITGVDLYSDDDTSPEVDIAPAEAAPAAQAPVEAAPVAPEAAAPAAEAPVEAEPAAAPAAAAPVEAAPVEAAPIAQTIDGLAPMPSNYGDILPVADVATSDDLDVVFIDGNADEGGIALAAESTTYGMPDVVTRAGWGADESKRCSSPTIDSGGVTAAVVHHTAGSNNYSAAESAGIMRGMYSYHADSLNWCDIGYNAVVDKFGTIYEGRYGGLDEAVQGAHVGGFNQNTFGISMMGNYDTTQPSAELIKSVGEMIGWKAAISDFDPEGTTGRYSGGFNGSKFSAGTTASLPNIFAHRDAHYNACPGQYGYAQMDNIRAYASEKYDAINAGSEDSSQSSSSATPSSSPTAPSSPAVEPSEDPSPSASTSTSTSTTVPDKEPSENDSVTFEPIETGSAANTINNAVNGNDSAIISLIGSIAAIAVSALAANPGEAGALTQLGDVSVLEGLSISDLEPVVSTLISISGDSEIEQTWNQIYTVFGPVLGSPRSGVATAAATEYALFDDGIILDSEQTGTYALWGTIADVWAGQGFDLGPLGLPLSNQYSTGDLLRVNFEGGYITLDPATGEADITLS